MTDKGATSSQVKSATRTLDIIEFVIAQSRPMVAQDIAAALAIPVSSLSYLLGTLVERGYLLREGRRYRPGPGLHRLQSRQIPFTLAERVAPLVRTLRVQLDETASFFIQFGWEIETIATETSEQALRYAVSTGTRIPMHALSAGKAILATLSEAELARFFSEAELARFTPHTLTTEKSLRDNIEQIRATGIARTEQEYSLGIRAIACAAGSLGALSVAIPLARYNQEVDQKVVDLLQKTAELLDPA